MENMFPSNILSQYSNITRQPVKYENHSSVLQLALLSSLPLASRHLLQIMKRNLQKIAACKFLAVSQGREIPNNGLADRTVKS